MLSDVQNGYVIPHDIHNIRGTAHVRTNRKDNIFMQKRLVLSFSYILEWGQGTCTSTKQTQCWKYSAIFLKDMLFIWHPHSIWISYCNYPKMESNDYPLCVLCCKNTICRGCWLDQPEMDRYHPVGSHQWYG